jgi:5-formyltetrahydrofolate cyclo-ligase
MDNADGAKHLAKGNRRQQCLGWRTGLSPAAYRQLSNRICAQLTTFLAAQLLPGSTVLAYSPHRQEPDIRLLLNNSTYRWALPRCLPDRQLSWHYWQPGDTLQIGSYGILEPEPSLPLAADAAALLVPALAMDRRGYRLGYGGGYFDRLLATPGWAQVLTVGVTFGATFVAELETDEWDYPLGSICTEFDCWMV